VTLTEDVREEDEGSDELADAQEGEVEVEAHLERGDVLACAAHAPSAPALSVSRPHSLSVLRRQCAYTEH
jgi:hypothetical protein